ncbi:MAG: thiosulfate/3-mercaptopyruvate sulfurtransferase [Candidatus Eremiobacteraeota bacterium]|nr:thiosulfate/3-mercaptopyruvate sulfurtransferase [Candidatus Eremiobacteraeota bacterium]
MSADFVEVDWLASRLGDPRVRIVDARSVPHGGVVTMPSGKEQFAAGHIPGAVHLDYADDLSDPATPYAARVAPPHRFALVMGAHGIGDDSIVVAYDAGTIPFAARMVWMLRYYGHAEAYVLAGGLPAWTAAGHALSNDSPACAHAQFTPRERHELRASRSEVLAIAQGGSAAQLLETQRDQTYAQRDRDIAGAVRLSGSKLLEDARGGRVADAATLERLVRETGLDPHARTIVSCGSGVSASGAWLALREAGFSDVAVYDGSWMEWEHDALPTVPKTSD